MKKLLLLIVVCLGLTACDKKPEFTISAGQATVFQVPEEGTYRYSYGASGPLRYVGSFDTKPGKHSLFTAKILSKTKGDGGEFVMVEKEMPGKLGYFYRSNIYENEAGEQHIVIIQMPFNLKK